MGLPRLLLSVPDAAGRIRRRGSQAVTGALLGDHRKLSNTLSADPPPEGALGRDEAVSMEFRILGPLEVIGDDGTSVAVGGSRERGVLALLLLSTNRVVPSERLAADLWGDHPPEGAAHALRVHMSRLRRALREAGAEEVLVTQSPGYVARVPPGALDAARFEDLLGRGREAATGGDHRAAAELLREALALWRGPPLADLPEAPVARAEAVRLEEARLVALEERIDADLACGRQAELVGELEGLTQVHPLREHLWYLRMLALYRAGRQAEALAAYQDLRHLLDDELGIAPSEALNRLQTAILRQDPELALPRVEPTAAATEPAADLVTVLVTDLDTAGDEQARWIFHAFRNLVADTATEHGGYELQSPGRGIAAAFPTAAEALEAALGIQADAPRPLGGQQVAVRTGLDAGPSPREQVIVAQHLCEQAAAARILCTQAVRDLLDRQLPEVAEVWKASPAAARQVPMPPLLTEIGRVFVGRTAELGRLTELWADVGRRTPRMVVLSGEPGVGKTRLAAEFARQVHAEGQMVLAGRCDEDLGVPYQPFVEALRQFVDHTPAALLDQGLGRHGGELVRLVPEIAQRRPDLPPAWRSDPETERYRLFDAVAAWLGAASAGQSLLLVLDDLHWAAKPTLLLLRHVSRSPEAPGLLVVCTYRDTELGHHHPLVDLLADLRRQGGVERLALSGLDEAAVITFLEKVGGHDLDEDNLAMAKAIHEGTEGNPFFVREVIRHLTETEKLQRQEGRWRARLPAAELEITQGVREVVAMRLGRLSEETETVLQVAAVVGTEFEPPVVQEAGGFGEETLLAALDEATAARLVLEVPGAALRYRFAHAIVRATLHDELTAARRTVLHRRVASAIELLHAGVHDEYLPALAHHWARAATGPDDATRAVDYAARAGARALTLLANDEAVTYYRQALALLTVAHGPREGPQRVELLIALGEAQRRAGDAGHRETLLEAARLARERGDAHALALAAVANSPGSKPSAFGITDHERVETLEAAIEALGASDSPLRARLLAILALELFHTGERARRLALSDEALAIARRLDDPATLSHVMVARPFAIGGPDTLAARLADTAELLEVAERLADPVTAHRAWWLRYRVAVEVGDLPEADRCLAIEARMTADLGQPSLEWMTALQRVARVLLAGDLTEADRLIPAALERGRDAGQPDALLYFAIQLFQLRDERGRLGEAEETVARVVASAPELPAIRAALGLVHAEVGRLDEARDIFEAIGQADFAQLPVEASTVVAYCFCARLAATLDDPGRAAQLHQLLAPYPDQIAVWAVGLGIGCVSYYLGLLALCMGALDEALERFAAAATIEQRVGAPTWLARTRVGWARALLTRRAPGDAEQAEHLLEQALDDARRLELAGVERGATALLGRSRHKGHELPS
jgi:DNA-binding SARP family transcriptional activator